MLRELHIRLRLDAHARTGRHIVEAKRDVHAVSNGRVVRDEAILRAFVVIRRHDEQCIGADAFRVLRELDGIRCLVRARAGNDGDPALHLFAGELDDRAMLRICHRRRLSRRARDDDGVRTAGNLILDHAGKLIEIDAVLRERRNKSDSCALENLFFHK